MEIVEKERIRILDGVRVVAISMVMIFHFYVNSKGKAYNYQFVPPELFRYGYLGVQLFFIISGFVITLTLAKCSGFSNFIKKRLIRLFPGMVICSFLTFVTCSLFDTNNLFSHAKSISNLILSDTFISPDLVNLFFVTKLNYIDVAYWSIWAELEFYVLAGLLYFFSPKHFLRNFAILAYPLVVIWYIFNSEHFRGILVVYTGEAFYRKMFELVTTFNFSRHTLWFLIGIIINKLYSDKKNVMLVLLLLSTAAFQMLIIRNVYVTVFIALALIFFLLFVYYQRPIKFLGTNILAKVGAASYSIYLIHMNIGLVMINKSLHYFRLYEWVLPVFLCVLFTLFGLLSYKYIETPMIRRLRERMGKE